MTFFPLPGLGMMLAGTCAVPLAGIWSGMELAGEWSGMEVASCACVLSSCALRGVYGISLRNVTYVHFRYLYGVAFRLGWAYVWCRSAGQTNHTTRTNDEPDNRNHRNAGTCEVGREARSYRRFRVDNRCNFSRASCAHNETWRMVPRSTGMRGSNLKDETGSSPSAD